MKQLPVPPPEYSKTHQSRVQESIYNAINDEVVQDIEFDGKSASDATRALFLGRVSLLSPNGTKFQILVDNSGNLSTTTI
jgi:hypothetical protein